MKERIRKISDNRIVIGAVIVLIAVATAFAASNNPLSIGKMSTDSAVFQYVAKVIRDGGMPYRDTFDHKGPAIYLINAVGLSISRTIGVWIVELLFILVDLICAYKLARLFGGGKRISIIAVLVFAVTLVYYFQGGNLVEEYACSAIIISLYIFAKYFVKGIVRWYDLVLCGASFAFVCLLRINMVAVWAVMCIGVLIDCLRGKKAKPLFMYLWWFMCGLLLVTLPVVLWLEKGGAWKAFIEVYFGFNFKYTSDGERNSFTMFLQVFVDFIRGLPVIFGATFLFHYAIEKKRLFEWLCVISLLFSLITMCMSGQSYGHYGMILCPIITCAFAMASGEISTGEQGKEIIISIGKKTKKYRIIVIKVFVLVTLLFIVRQNGQKVVYETRVDEIAKVIKEYSSERDRITVCGNRDYIYLQSDRWSSSIYSFQDPIASVDPEIKKKYIEDVRSLEAKLIVIGKTSTWHKELDDIITAHYELLKNVNGTEIYRRK